MAARLGVDIELDESSNAVAALFCEELGAVIQVRSEDAGTVIELLEQTRPLSGHVKLIGHVNETRKLRIHRAGNIVFENRTERLAGGLLGDQFPHAVVAR